MTDGLDSTARPADGGRGISGLIAVEVAIAALRRNVPIAVRGGPDEVDLVLAAEVASADAIELVTELCGATPRLVWGVAPGPAKRDAAGAAALEGGDHVGPDVLRKLLLPRLRHDSMAERLDASGVPVTASGDAALRLAKLAGLLPAVLAAPLPGVVGDTLAWAAERHLPLVRAEDITAYRDRAARSLCPVGQARIPLSDARTSRVVAFRPSTGDLEHLAIIVGEPDPATPVLARLHSSCLTGDVLGSLRCDCGEQLRGAIAAMDAASGGIVLYLAQEGRGIGLVNKLRAYELQDEGLDTIDANEALGFEPDERMYLPAAEMLRQLGYARVRLMTNNLDKVAALAAYGVEIVERVPHAFPSNPHNAGYLKTKASRAGHQLEVA